jgi:hypothetical protein
VNHLHTGLLDRPWFKAALVPLWLVACTPGEDGGDPVVARAFDQKLYWSDIRQVIPLEVSGADSAAMASAFITNWLNQQVVLHKAEQNIGGEDKDFEVKLRDYRNSLLIFAYEQELVNQKLDTAVGAGELAQYYEANKVNFELRDNILRARWFKVTEGEKRTRRRLEEAFMSGKPEDMREVELWLAQRGHPIMDRSSTWTTWSELRAELPEGRAAEEVHLQSGQRTVLREGDQMFFLDVLELRERNSVSPLDLVERDIRSIVLNQRKLQLLERMRQDLYREALDRKDIEVL